jgi:hypothetical protein
LCGVTASGRCLVIFEFLARRRRRLRVLLKLHTTALLAIERRNHGPAPPLCSLSSGAAGLPPLDPRRKVVDVRLPPAAQLGRQNHQVHPPAGTTLPANTHRHALLTHAQDRQAYSDRLWRPILARRCAAAPAPAQLDAHTAQATRRPSLEPLASSAATLSTGLVRPPAERPQAALTSRSSVRMHRHRALP